MLDQYHNQLSYTNVSHSDSHSDSTTVASMILHPRDANTANLSHGTHDKTNSTDWDWDDNKPYFIVHIGPSKTGTTTIQKESVALEDVLAHDDYVYMGRHAQRKYLKQGYKALKEDSCLFETESYLLNDTGKDKALMATDVPCWNNRMSNLQQYHKNIVVSEEALSYRLPQNALNAIHTAFRDWNLLYHVATYRRYAEWMLSALKERQSKGNCVGAKSKWYVNATQVGSLCLEPMRFLPWKIYANEVISNYGTTMYQNIDTTVPKIKIANIPVKILNMHEERHITESFYCDMVPNAPQTCKHYLDQEDDNSAKQNVRVVITSSCSNMVYTAAKGGIIGIDTTNQTRHEATLHCVSFMEENNITHAGLPLICPKRDMLENLLNKSLEFEKKMVPEFYKSKGGEVDHRRSFWLMAEERKEFCHVDIAQVLHGRKTWEDALIGIKSTNWNVTYK